MSRAGLDDILYQGESADPPEALTGSASELADIGHNRAGSPKSSGAGNAGPRRTPRKSLILVLADHHVMSPERLAERMPIADDQELVDVIVACAGQPTNLSALQRKVRDLQVLLAPAGTSAEDLRELAMKQAPGDIVTLLSGALLHTAPSAERELSLTS